MIGWPYVKLASLAEFKNGLNYTKNNWGRGLKVIGVSDFKDNLYPNYNALEEINPAGVVREADYLAEDDILFVRSNGNRELIGRCLYIKNIQEKISHSGFTIRLRFKSDRVFVFFYVYLFKSSLIRAVLSTHGIGTNINNLNQQILSKLKVPLPPVTVQKKIAAILSAYDDLIENNKRRIALLEKMAEEIYREWFVRFRFPGHERVKIVKGIPEGWKAEKVSAILERKRFGRIYRESELLQEGKVVVIDQSQKEWLGFHNGKAEHEASIKSPLILFGDHSCKMQLMIEPFSLAENVIPFSCKGSMPILFLFYTIHSLTTTTEYKRHWTELINKQALIPVSDLQYKFDDHIRDLLVLIRKLKSVNLVLNKSRDLLLPRLISGKLSVENLDIQFPPSMEDSGHEH